VNGSFRDYFQTALKPNVAIGQDMQLSLMPSRVFRADLFDEYQRTIDPFTGMPTLSSTMAPGATGAPTPAANLTVPSYSRDKVGVGTRLQLSTPGQLFRVGAGYRFDEDYFEDNVFKGNRNSMHTVSSDTSWEFLPQTALVWNGSVRLHDWQSQSSGMPTAIGNRVSGTLVDSKIGLNGALTPRIGLTIAGGYSAGFYRDNNDYEGVIAQLSGRWKIQENALWTLGYDRQFNVSFQGNHVRTDRIGTSIQATISGALLVALRGAFSFVTFGADPMLKTRTDRNLQLNLNGEYRFVDWLAATAEVGYIQNFTDYQFPGSLLSTGGQTLTYNPQYKQVQVWGGLRAFL